MSDRTNFLADVMRHGHAATVTVKTGTACPCMVWRDSARPSYSAEWHRINTSAAACNGLGIITVTTTTVAIKGFFYAAAIIGNTPGAAALHFKEVIGEFNRDDMLLVGTAKASDGTFYDLSAMVERKDKITYSGKDYLVLQTFDLAEIAQWVYLKRIA